MEAPALAGQVLTVKQAPFSHEGFASTGVPTNSCLALSVDIAELPRESSSLCMWAETSHVMAALNSQESTKQSSGVVLGDI